MKLHANCSKSKVNYRLKVVNVLLMDSMEAAFKHRLYYILNRRINDNAQQRRINRNFSIQNIRIEKSENNFFCAHNSNEI